MFTALVVKLLNTPQHKIWAISHKKNIRGLAITLFVLELLIFEGFRFHPDPAISQQYSNYFYHNNLIYTEPESSFIHYRVPFSFESSTTSFSADSKPWKDTEGRLFYIFFGPELYHIDKVAFPAVVEKEFQSVGSFQLAKHSMRSLREQDIPEEIVVLLKPLKLRTFIHEHDFLMAVENQIGREQMLLYATPILKSAHVWQPGQSSFTEWDHFYMTTHFYDYLVNVKLDKQALTSHLSSPILNFFPEQNVIELDTKYDIVARLNTASRSELQSHIFIEQDQTIHKPALEIEEFFESSNFVEYTPEERSAFIQNRRLKFTENRDAVIDIADYDINHLSVRIDAFYDGYVYFGDGYSKHWKAYVDGKPAIIEKTNINFKSVFTPAGKHQVDFVFDPVLFRYSLYAYFLGNVLFLIIIAFYCFSDLQGFGKPCRSTNSYDLRPL